MKSLFKSKNAVPIIVVSCILLWAVACSLFYTYDLFVLAWAIALFITIPSGVSIIVMAIEDLKIHGFDSEHSAPLFALGLIVLVVPTSIGYKYTQYIIGVAEGRVKSDEQLEEEACKELGDELGSESRLVNGSCYVKGWTKR